HSACSNSVILAITGTVIPVAHSYSAWIGLRQKNWPKDKKWTWTDGTPVDYLNWAPGEPNDYENSEHCVQVLFYSYQRWNHHSKVIFPREQEFG
ncbi:unnamed protein product, partial [Haemonchus placei]|uniref:C-type lectin domain-containing protein n=1 Tax=Haemonchus placei TaxID=6290 RepID=A0A0N4WY65_HAEPC